MNSFGVGPNLVSTKADSSIYFSLFFYCLFSESFLLKQKVIIQPIVLYSFLFFVLMFFNTYAVSFIRFHLLDTYYEFNSILNFSFLLFFILTIYLVIISSPKEFNQISKKLYFYFTLHILYFQLMKFIQVITFLYQIYLMLPGGSSYAYSSIF